LRVVLFAAATIDAYMFIQDVNMGASPRNGAVSIKAA
jgi:hypothetical protein